MSPLSNTNNSNNTNSNSLSSSHSSANNITSSSAFKPLVSENRQLSMLSSTVTSAAGSAIDPYTSDLTSAYGSAYAHHHHHHLNSQLSTQDYLNVHHQTLPLSVYKSEHDDLQSGYSFARPVKLYEHSAATSSSGSAVGCAGMCFFHFQLDFPLRIFYFQQ